MSGYQIIAGVDEAGRGCLAGPVVAAALILPRDFSILGINDSKKLSKENREKIYDFLTNDPRVCYGVGIVDHTVIDEINILQASLRAMLLAIDDLKIKPDYLLIDGGQLPQTELPKIGIIQGDAKSQSIAGASVIAKVTRDSIMENECHQKWPSYGFDKHKGYGTKAHREAIERYGPCPIHRLSFSPFIHKPIEESDFGNAKVLEVQRSKIAQY